MRWLIGVCALAMAACATPPAPSEQGDEGERRGGPASKPAKPGLVDHDVVWPKVAPREDLRAALPAAAREAVDASKVPVLVMDHSPFLAAMKVIAKPRWTAIHTRAEGVTVSLSGTRSAHRYSKLPKAEGTARVRDLPAWVTQNERIWSASWIEGGVAYVLEVECDRLPDPRCEDDGYLRSLASSLGYVGGEGATR